MYEAPIPMINYVLVSITAAVLAYVTAMDVENAENEYDSSSAVSSLPSLNDSYDKPVEVDSPAPAPAPVEVDSPAPAPAEAYIPPVPVPAPTPASPPMAEAYIPPKSEVEGGKRRTAVKNKTTRNATIISNKKQNKKKTRNNKNRKLK